jgi:oxygen-independent coproporphyrinogen III oxidase
LYIEGAARSIFIRHDELNRHRCFHFTYYTPVNPTNFPIPLTQFTKSSPLSQGNSEGFERLLTAEPWLSDARKANSVYIHIPFCFHKCHYCDFYSIVGTEVQHELYVQQLIKELEYVSPYLQAIDSIFVGGGTPTIFDDGLLGIMLEAVQKYIPVTNDCEWTIEANPETVTRQKAETLFATGVNRVSIGAQTFDSELLKSLERCHDPESVSRAVGYITAAGIHDFNIDLIHSIPSQTVEQLQFDIEQATALNPTHLSCYSLTYEPNTPLLKRLECGYIERLSHDKEAAMFALVREELSSRGYAQYEISNFAKDGFECRHNISYWKNKNWWAFGASASGHLCGLRWKNTPRISEYFGFDVLPPVMDVEKLNTDESAGESFMLGLRLVRGMNREWVDSLIEQSSHKWRSDVIERYINEGYLMWSDDYLCFTQDGQCFADTVIIALLKQEDPMTDSTRQEKP